MKQSRINKIILTIFVSFQLFFLGGCGGGNSTESNTRVGQFIGGGPVSNLRFITDTHSGNTNSEGEFEYETGESIQFYVGNILIGRATAKDIITPFSLAGFSTPPIEALDIKKALSFNDFIGEGGISEIAEFSRGRPISKAVNISVFLQTLDEDSDHSNGIQISELTHTHGSRLTVNFDRLYFEFLARSYTFRQLLSRGKSGGLWVGSREVINPAIALDRLYESLGLSPNIYILTKRGFDTNGDGSVNSSIRKTYNENGQKISFQSSRYNITETYGTNGKIIQSEYDDSPFGSIDKRIVFEFDSDGYLITKKTDADADGAFDTVETSTYDEYSNLTKIEVDNLPLGSIDKSTIKTYSNKGRLMLETVDISPIGSINSSRRHIYNGANKRIEIQIDDNADGVVDKSIKYTYNTRGNLKGFKDSLGEITVLTYQTEAPYRINVVDIDYDGDSIIDLQKNNFFNDKGLKNKIEYDQKPLGSLNALTNIEYNEQGFITQIIKDTNNDGVSNKTIKSQYDDKANIVLEETYLDNSTEISSSTSSEYILTNKWANIFGSISSTPATFD